MSAYGTSGGLLIHEQGYGKGWPLVQGACPACRRRTLFLGTSGYVTCGAAECPDPAAATDLLDAPPSPSRPSDTDA